MPRVTKKALIMTIILTAATALAASDVRGQAPCYDCTVDEEGFSACSPFLIIGYETCEDVNPNACTHVGRCFIPAGQISPDGSLQTRLARTVEIDGSPNTRGAVYRRVCDGAITSRKYTTAETAQVIDESARLNL